MSTIIDADGHVIEGRELVRELLARFPEHVRIDPERRDQPGAIRFEGRRYPEPEGPGAGCPPQHGTSTAGVRPGSVETVLADADRDLIDQMVLFPSMGIGAPTFEDRGFAAGFASLYNEWLAGFCARSGGRLHGVAVLPIEDVETSIKLMNEAKHQGLVCVMLPPGLRTRNLDHPDLDPFYRAAVELDMPLGVHGAPGMHLPKIGVDRFTNYIQVHCISFPFDMMTAMTAVVTGGVLERHPKLRIAFLEAGVGWVPFFIDRLHEHYEKRGDWIANGWKREPREYLERGQIYVSCEPEEPILPGVIDVLGDEFIMYASDYPHWDGSWPESTKPLRERQDIRETSRARILGQNAARFFHLAA